MSNISDNELFTSYCKNDHQEIRYEGKVCPLCKEKMLFQAILTGVSLGIGNTQQAEGHWTALVQLRKWLEM